MDCQSHTIPVQISQHMKVVDPITCLSAILTINKYIIPLLPNLLELSTTICAYLNVSKKNVFIFKYSCHWSLGQLILPSLLMHCSDLLRRPNVINSTIVHIFRNHRYLWYCLSFNYSPYVNTHIISIVVILKIMRKMYTNI